MAWPRRPHGSYSDLPADKLGFRPRPMVRWFAPYELLRAGALALLSTLFGAYADRREIQALRARQEAWLAEEDAPEGESKDDALARQLAELGVHDFSRRSELWLDYVADLGDGFDSTYTVARLLARPTLAVRDDERTHETCRGDVLVMGGDQVYPTATREEYENRLRGPYDAALPSCPDGEVPRLFAIPGNHDWYDGLTSFLRLFCQRRSLGAWQTEQRRSYFALKLPHGWWLWGVDIQLEADIDEPQQAYFRAIASNPRVMPKGAKIILCLAEPSWVFSAQRGEQAYHNLAYFEQQIIRAHGHEHVVGLAGDLHVYARYEQQPEGETPPAHRKQRFVAGGGGAYLYPSHQLPEHLTLPADDATEHYSVRREAAGGARPHNVYPSRLMSRLLAFGVLRFPLVNVAFAGLLGAVYALMGWLAQASSIASQTFGDASLLDVLADARGPMAALDAVWQTVRFNPVALLVVLLCVGGLIAMADHTRWRVKVPLGIAHAGWHLIGASLLLWGYAHLLQRPWAFGLGIGGALGAVAVLFWVWFVGLIDALGRPRMSGLGLTLLHVGAVIVACGLALSLLALPASWHREMARATLFALVMLGAGGLLGGFLMGFYLLAANLLLFTAQGLKGVHANEVFCAQSIADFKHFLRLRIGADGALTVYPIGIARVCRHWRHVADAAPGQPHVEPARGDIAERARLIEPPVRVAP